MLGESLNSLEIRSIASSPPPGPIYNAVNRLTGQTATVHTLRAGLPIGARASEEFYRRQRAASLMGKHPRAWVMLDSGAYEDTRYYVLAGPPGESLAVHMDVQPVTGATLLRSGGVSAHDERSFGNLNSVSSWTIRNWMRDLAWAVDFFHQQGLVLGNLSPHTIWISCEGAAMIMDPGAGGDLSWHLEGKGASADRYEQDMAFLAPEQVMGSPVGPHTDVYALGVILFWLLGGQFPPRPRRDATRIGRYLPLIPLSRRADPALAAICKKAAAISPANRYGSADFLRAALAANDDDLRAARQKFSHAARNTLMHSSPAEPTSPSTDDTGATRLGRWWQSWW